MTVKLTEHELEMLEHYTHLTEEHQQYVRETLETILDGIQEEKKPLVRQVLLSMGYWHREQKYPI